MHYLLCEAIEEQMPWEKQFDVDEVLDKAMQAFWERGYQGTSMQDLVERTGIHRGSLYATYRDKQALFRAALLRYDERVRGRLLERLESLDQPREAIRQALMAFVEGLSDKGGNKGCFMTNTALELAAHDREVGRIVARAQEDMEAFFARMVDKGKQRGEIGAHVDSRAAARGLLASFLGLVVLTRSRPQRALLESIVAEAMRRLD